MSLIRTGIVLSLAIAALPSDKGQQQRLYMQAAGAVDWAATYCDRNPQTCVKAGEYWDVFKAKAEFAGELALEAVKNYAAGGAQSLEPAAAKASFVQKRGTLTQDDLRPSWRGTSRGI